MDNHSLLTSHRIFPTEKEWRGKGRSSSHGAIAWLPPPNVDFLQPRIREDGVFQYSLAAKSTRIGLPHYEARGAGSCHLADPTGATFLQNKAMPEKWLHPLPAPHPDPRAMGARGGETSATTCLPPSTNLGLPWHEGFRKWDDTVERAFSRPGCGMTDAVSLSSATASHFLTEFP